MRDWNCPIEYDPEFCSATCVAMENLQPLRRRTETDQFHLAFKQTALHINNIIQTTCADANMLTCQRWL